MDWFPKPVAKITDDLDQLLAFYDYPAEHWAHLQTAKPIEWTFATVRYRTEPGCIDWHLSVSLK
jgi:transposase-like protein